MPETALQKMIGAITILIGLIKPSPSALTQLLVARDGDSSGRGHRSGSRSAPGHKGGFTRVETPARPPQFRSCHDFPAPIRTRISGRRALRGGRHHTSGQLVRSKTTMSEVRQSATSSKSRQLRAFSLAKQGARQNPSSGTAIAGIRRKPAAAKALAAAPSQECPMSRARLIPIKALMALILSEEPADINLAVAAKFTEPAGDIAPLKQKSWCGWRMTPITERRAPSVRGPLAYAIIARA